MGFRDENEALRARIQTLESETDRLREEKRSLEDALSGKVEVPAEGPTLEDSAAPAVALSLRDTIQNRVSKRNAQERMAKEKERAAAATKRAKVVRRLKKRKPRVRVESASDGRVVIVESHGIRNQLRQQLAWGFGFPFIAVGYYVVGGLLRLFDFLFDLSFPQQAVASLVTWTVLLAAINGMYAMWKIVPYRLEITGGHFALFKRGDKPLLFGTLDELKVVAPNPDPMELHRVRIADGRKEEAIDSLLAEDVLALQSAIRASKDTQERKQEKKPQEAQSD